MGQTCTVTRILSASTNAAHHRSKSWRPPKKTEGVPGTQATVLQRAAESNTRGIQEKASGVNPVPQTRLSPTAPTTNGHPSRNARRQTNTTVSPLSVCLCAAFVRTSRRRSHRRFPAPRILLFLSCPPGAARLRSDPIESDIPRRFRWHSMAPN